MLTKKQQRFVDEYMIDCNAKQAAIRSGYSPKSAEFQGSKLLADSKVSQVIKERQEEASKVATLTRNDKLKKLEQVIDKFLLDGYNTSQALKAIEIHNKMVGDNAADKVEQHIHQSEQPLFGEDKENGEEV